jgi:hypothetical protein
MSCFDLRDVEEERLETDVRTVRDIQWQGAKDSGLFRHVERTGLFWTLDFRTAITVYFWNIAACSEHAHLPFWNLRRRPGSWAVRSV